MERRELIGQVSTALVGLGGTAVVAALALGDPAPYRSALIYAGGLFGLAGMIGWIWLWYAPAGEASPEYVAAMLPQPGALEPLSPRITADHERITLGDAVTPDFLMRLCEGKTEIQADGSVALYRGTWLRVSGALIAATKLMDMTTVSIMVAGGTKPRQVYMIFKSDQDRIGVLHQNEIVTAIGQIKEIKMDMITLDNCELC